MNHEMHSVSIALNTGVGLVECAENSYHNEQFRFRLEMDVVLRLFRSFDQLLNILELQAFMWKHCHVI